MNNKLTISLINKRVIEHNLRCISELYSNNKQKLLWQCLVCGGVFSRSFNMISRNFIGCANCRGELFTKRGRPKLQTDTAIERVKKIAAARGGRYIDGDFYGAHSKLHFKCSRNHDFVKKYSDVVNVGRWCPRCSRNNNLSEEICRAYFEQIFHQKFPTVRPDWLLAPTGYRMELDGFCDAIGVAFEHQGTFHYEYKTDKNVLARTIEYDRLKVNICKSLDVTLIQIPQLFNRTPLNGPNGLKNLIKNTCKSAGICVGDIDNIEIDLRNVYSGSKFDEYKTVAESHGGRCVSSTYLGATHKLEWE